MTIEATNSAHFMVGPLVALVVMLVLAGIMRWIWSPGRRTQSLESGDYGLLAEVARLQRREDAVLLQERLASQGIRATVGPAAEASPGTTVPYVVLVFPADETRARAVVPQRGGF